MLRLIKQWLKAPVEITDGDGKRRMEGGKASTHGVPPAPRLRRGRLSRGQALARANQGAPGVDGATFERIEAAGLEDWLTQLGEELRAKHAHGLAKPGPRDVSVPTGAAGDDPKARRRRAATWYPGPRA